HLKRRELPAEPRPGEAPRVARAGLDGHAVEAHAAPERQRALVDDARIQIIVLVRHELAPRPPGRVRLEALRDGVDDGAAGAVAPRPRRHGHVRHGGHVRRAEGHIINIDAAPGGRRLGGRRARGALESRWCWQQTHLGAADDVAPPSINLRDHQRVRHQIAAAHALEPLRYRRGPLQAYDRRRIVVERLRRDAGDGPGVEEARVAADDGCARSVWRECSSGVDRDQPESCNARMHRYVMRTVSLNRAMQSRSNAVF
ncbi:unnamed protein product, partial [Pelagomonas calceolata]